MKRKLLLIGMGSMLAMAASNAVAVTSNGTIGATLTLSNGCLINGSPTQNGINFRDPGFWYSSSHLLNAHDPTCRCQWREYLYRSMHHRQLFGSDNRQHQLHRTWHRRRDPRNASTLFGECDEYGSGRRVQPL